MLIGIPKLISPELLKIMMEMGHGDELVLADANFPAASIAQRLVRCDGHPIPELLEAILQLFPLDTYVEHTAALMDKVPGDTVETPIWKRYQDILKSHTSLEEPFEYAERFAFYERAKKAYVVVATGEGAQYANIILKKGVIKQQG
ncbi:MULTISPECIES: L-fucose mutarotase [Paenibacillus]|uniref:L-fucose mutarotase n=1 Tax=Paenibacillus radicis (ex Xue et al. 2023) TaxID=2972489 RepID=A0ABT1YVE3_9BACL|nr:L-fucose mutarotase [Paenibacillus radicis (ex Xue et al. 2023)]MCR8636927.1 L-fucose mutarotase [Paenibacillus radicis (ex Xue et al. 2023)]